MRRSDPGSSGMTLPELLVAVVVLGLMAAVGIGGVGRSRARTPRTSAAARRGPQSPRGARRTSRGRRRPDPSRAVRGARRRRSCEC